jgi:hypothetical protein
MQDTELPVRGDGRRSVEEREKEKRKESPPTQSNVRRSRAHHTTQIKMVALHIIPHAIVGNDKGARARRISAHPKHAIICNGGMQLEAVAKRLWWRKSLHKNFPTTFCRMHAKVGAAEQGTDNVDGESETRKE